MNELHTDLTIINLSIFDNQLHNTHRYTLLLLAIYNTRVDIVHLSRLDYAIIESTALQRKCSTL